eukprot:12486736-Ditylum_brightwellii.AAC.1
MTGWLCWYQTLVNLIVRGTYLQFTTELWEPTEFRNEFECVYEDKGEDAPMEKWLKWVKVVMEKAFPFLDINISWTM